MTRNAVVEDEAARAQVPHERVVVQRPDPDGQPADREHPCEHGAEARPVRNDAVRTRLPYASENPDTEPLDSAATGDLTFRLFSVYPSPYTHVGKEVEVRGFLIRTGAARRINVTSLRTVASDCRTTNRTTHHATGHATIGRHIVR